MTSAAVAAPVRDGHGDPGLGFWLGYAEQEGALTEDRGDHALVLLPAHLRADLDLPEMVAVTADPEVAREDGAVLLLPGNPLLDATAARVVEGGDAGHAWVAWPRRELPRTAVLARRARESLAADHGRIDRQGEAAPVWLPLLRVAAVVETSASLDLRFQERHEAWVDARTGLALPEAIRAVAAGSPWRKQPEQRHRVLVPDLAHSLPAAHRLLTVHAEARAAELSAQAGQARAAELERVDAYYASVLATIAGRRAAADDDERRVVLDAQADATRDEHVRRRREVEDSYRTAYELRPFRLQLVFVPTVRLPVVVRRGARTYPLELMWVVDAHAFAPVACPHCGCGDPLVAGRQRLGCTGCLPRGVPGGGAQAPQRGTGSGASHVAPAPAPREPAPRAPSGRDRDPRPVGRRGQPPAGEPARRGAAPAPPAAARETGGSPPPERVRQVGDRLALRFWQDVAEQRRWHRRKIGTDTPLRALHRVCGPEGPLVDIGVEPGQWLSEVSAATAPPAEGPPHATVGTVVAGEGRYPFVLRWELEASGPVLLELLPGLTDGGELPSPWSLHPAVAERLFAPVPAPAGLDGVACALWEVERPTGGLPFAIRCLTAWWRAAAHIGPVDDPAVAAAAVASLVASRSGLHRPRAAAAADHGADRRAVAALVRGLQRHLQLSPQRPW